MNEADERARDRTELTEDWARMTEPQRTEGRMRTTMIAVGALLLIAALAVGSWAIADDALPAAIACFASFAAVAISLAAIQAGA